MRRICNRKDFVAGVLFTALGGATVWISLAYPAGNPISLGTGYFPRLLGCLLAALGMLITLRALHRGGSVAALRIAWRPVLAVLGGVALFGMLIESAGLALTSALVVVMVSAARREWRPTEVALTAAILAVATSILFVAGLGLQMPVWPALR